jgi:hypothetical protein
MTPCGNALAETSPFALPASAGQEDGRGSVLPIARPHGGDPVPAGLLLVFCGTLLP